MVNQPFMINSNIPLLADGTPDRTYLAPDCFHFARKTHNGAAVALWNNMLQPVGRKDSLSLLLSCCTCAQLAF